MQLSRVFVQFWCFLILKSCKLLFSRVSARQKSLLGNVGSYEALTESHSCCNRCFFFFGHNFLPHIVSSNKFNIRLKHHSGANEVKIFYSFKICA